MSGMREALRDHQARTLDDQAKQIAEMKRKLAARVAIRFAEPGAWQPMSTAPKDGTRILIWFVHANAKYSKNPIEEGWEAAHEAYWIDHNGGGWTWYGLCGEATMWQPMPPAPKEPRP